MRTPLVFQLNRGITKSSALIQKMVQEIFIMAIARVKSETVVVFASLQGHLLNKDVILPMCRRQRFFEQP
jgi:hypothetical protein